MEKRFPGKKLAWLMSTLLIGALGSGLWEAVLKPSMLWFGTFALDVATLGLNSLRDSMYLEVAKGTCERAALATYSMITGAACGLLIGTVLIAYQRRKKKETKKNEQYGKDTKALWPVVTVTLMFVTIIFFQSYRVSYISRAASHVEQMIAIVSPYLSPEQLSIYRSKFALVSNRGEYISLVTELHRIAQDNSVKAPRFNIY